MRKPIVALALSCCFTVAYSQASVTVNGGWMDGNDYRQNNIYTKRAYVAGMVSGFYEAPIFGAPTSRVDKLAACTRSMNAVPDQLVAIVDQWVERNPTSWGDQMNSIVFRAMREACASRGKPLD